VTNAAISVDRALKRFKSRVIIEQIHLTVPYGQFCGIVGANGSGKTTLLRCIAGLMIPNSGSISVLGQRLFPGPGTLPEGVGALIESPGFIGNLSGTKNLEFLLSLSSKRTQVDIASVLSSVGLSPGDRTKVRSYSLGMTQRLGIAQAIMEGPRLLLLDEPQYGLDPDGVLQIRNLLSQLHAKGTTIVMVSHQIDEVSALCDVVYEMRGGHLVLGGTSS